MEDVRLSAILDEYAEAGSLVLTTVSSSQSLVDGTIGRYYEVVQSLSNGRTLHGGEVDNHSLSILVARLVLHIASRHLEGVLCTIVQLTVIEAYRTAVPLWL